MATLGAAALSPLFARRRGDAMPPGGDGAKAGIYTRFIPREELTAFAAWTPGDFSESPGAARPASPAAGDGSAADPAAQTAEQVRQARQSGYQDGYRDGLVALEGFKQSFAHQTTLQVAALVQTVGTQLDKMQQEMAEALATAAIQLARQIVRSELECRPESVAAVAHEALETLLLSARHITLRVHPDDHSLVSHGAGEALAARGARLVADVAITRGGCIVESNIGVIDATIEARWRRAAATLGGDEPWVAAAAASPTPAAPSAPVASPAPTTAPGSAP